MLISNITLSQDLSLPRDIMTQRFAIFGVSGSGKTYAAMKIVEQFCHNKLPIVVIDLIGIWWGLRLSADGEGEGFPFLIIGKSDRTDITVSHEAGKQIAYFVEEEKVNVILDLSGFEEDEQKQFIADFLRELYVIHDRTPLLIVADECATYAPQNASKGDKESLRAVSAIARMGRAKGLGLCLIAQRPADVSKSVFSQCEMLFALRTTISNDKLAIKQWLTTNAPDDAEGVAQALERIKNRDVLVCSPKYIEGTYKIIQVAQRESFDSSKTPEVGAVIREPKPLTEIDIDKLQSLLEPEEGEGESVEMLKRIRFLERQLTEARANPIVKEVPVITPEALAELQTLLSSMSQIFDRVGKLVTPAMALLQQDQSFSCHTGNQVEKVSEFTQSPAPSEDLPLISQVSRKPARLEADEKPVVQALFRFGDLTRQDLVILTVSDRPSMGEILSGLLSKEVITGSSVLIRLTDLGQQLGASLKDWLIPASSEALVARWKKAKIDGKPMPKKSAELLDFIVRQNGKPVSRERAAKVVGYAPNSEMFKGCLAKLTENCLLLESPETLFANPLMFKYVTA